MLDLLGYDGVGPLFTSYGAQEEQHNRRESTETFLRSPSMMHDILTGDSALEMFDWALWDHEMQYLSAMADSM
ncbi:hypothetical protein ABZX51_006869 [Aspergillus tubingensis]